MTLLISILICVMAIIGSGLWIYPFFNHMNSTFYKNASDRIWLKIMIRSVTKPNGNLDSIEKVNASTKIEKFKILSELIKI